MKLFESQDLTRHNPHGVTTTITTQEYKGLPPKEIPWVHMRNARKRKSTTQGHNHIMRNT